MILFFSKLLYRFKNVIFVYYWRCLLPLGTCNKQEKTGHTGVESPVSMHSCAAPRARGTPRIEVLYYSKIKTDDFYLIKQKKQAKST